MSKSKNRAPPGAEQLLTASPGAMVVVDAEARIIFANPALGRLLRRPVDKLIGRSSADWNGLGADGAVIKHDDKVSSRALRGESVADYEMTILAPDGGEVFVSVAGEPLRDESGAITGAVITLTDLSAVKRVRDQLHHSHERMSYALSAAKMIAWDWEPASGAVDHTEDVNQHTERRVERRDQFQELIHPDDRDRVRETFDTALKSGEDYLCEYRLALPGGAVRWVESRGRASRGPSGAPRMSGVITDITDRKAAEIALAEGEERLRITLEGAGAGFYDVDLSTGEGHWSRTTFAQLGLTPPADLRANLNAWRERVHPDDIAKVMEWHNEAVRSLGHLVMDYRITRADTGEIRWLSTYGQILRRDDGTLRSVGIVIDATERRRAEEREKLLMREVDHRAKNVLAVVQSLLQLTPRRDVESFVHGVTGRIAAIARAHTLLAKSRWHAASIYTLVREELAAFRVNEQILLKGEDVSVEPDAAQAIAMVLHELATNAAKYGGLSRKDGHVEIEVASREGGLELRWLERAPHILGAPARQGFGLRLIKQLVERQLDGSTAFTWAEGMMEARLFLKVGISRAETPAAVTEKPATAPSAELSGRIVLVLEDDGLISMALQEELERQGARAIAFANVDAALGHLQSARPDLAVLDVNVHGRGAGPVAEALTQLGAPFIYATGYSDDLGELPRAPIVRKPCTPAEVCAALRLASGAA